MVKNLPDNLGDVRDVGLISGLEDPLEEGMATHTSILAWRVPWTEKPGRLQFIGSQRVGHDLAHVHAIQSTETQRKESQSPEASRPVSRCVCRGRVVTSW